MATKKKLTVKQEAAAQAYIENGGNRSEAYRDVYNAENMKPETIWVKASELFSNGKVAVRVLELQEAHLHRHNITVDSITNELDENRNLAKEEKNPAAMNASTMGKAKIHGLITDKIEVDKADLKGMSDDELQAVIDGRKS